MAKESQPGSSAFQMTPKSSVITDLIDQFLLLTLFNLMP